MTGRRVRWLAATLALVFATATVVAVAFWTALGIGSGSGTNGSLAPASISVPGSALNSVTVTWSAQASLVPASDNSAITYSVERKLGAGTYAPVASGGCSGVKPHGTASCSDASPASGSYSYRVVATYQTWTATSSEAGPVTFTADTAAPATAVTLSGVTGGAFKSGATVYYRGTASGSFTLTNAVSDSGSGPASSATAALTGTSTGWIHSPSVVSTPAGGPYVSSAFSWSPLTTSSPGETVTGSDAAGNSTPTALTFTDDSIAPSGGAVDATGLGGTGGRYSTSTALSIAFTTGTDAGAGLATSGAQLLRATAPLGDGSCGAYGTYAQVGANDPTSPVANTVPVDHTCYRYRYLVTDRVGNQATYTSPDIKVDTAAPHPDFLQPITSPEPVRPGPVGSDTGDIDNDGDQDIVTANLYATTSSVLINNGVGSFRERTVASNLASLDAGLGNFDNDGNLDLVLLYQQAPPAPGLLVIFKGGGDGSFTYLALTNELVSTGLRPTTLAVGNFNGDAIDDVAVVNSGTTPATDVGSVTTHLGNPAGNDTFSAAAPAQTLTAQIGTTDLAFGDFNGGASDLVVTNAGSNSISFLAGNGTGFDAAANIAAGVSVGTLDTANLNAGTNRDIVATVPNSNPSAVRTLFGDGAGGFPSQATTVAVAASGNTPLGIVANDLDNDGDADVAVANGGTSSVSMLANDGAGGFSIAPASPETGLGSIGTYPWGLVSADFDGTGYADLAVSPIFTSPGELRMLLNQNGTKADLSITQTDSPDPVAAGQSLTYSLTVANAGPGTPSSVKATDDLPTGVTFNAGASSPSCSAAGSAPVTVTCDYGAVASGSPESLQVVVTPSGTPSTLTNTATVAGNLADATPANNTSSTTTTVADTTGPSGGSVDASGLVGTGARYSTSTALSIALAKGTDPSGLAASGAQLFRSTATLTSGGTADGSCGSYSVPAQVGADDPVSPVADTVPAGQACYRYEYRVADTVGNPTTYTSPDIKIDTTAPVAGPAFAFSSLTNTYWNGTTLFYRSDATSGSFTATASATDTTSGISSYALPTLPAGWTGTAGALGVKTYSWSTANPTAPVGAQNATATNHATLTSPTAGFTLTSDVTAPATGSVSYTDGYYTSPSVSVTFARGTDGGSGVNATSGLLQRADATLTGVTCGSYSAFATVTGGTNPTSPFADTTVASGNCYQYRYLASDNVGNQATYTSASVAKVDSTPPTITRAVAAKTDGTTPGTIRQGGAYYIYGQVTDNTSVSTVTANTSSFDTGVTAASLSVTGGPWTVGGLSYNYRSASLTANTPLTTGSTPSYTVTATDAATNTAGPTSFTATIETYNSVITGTAGLVSYWRFNDGAITGDEFTDTAGTVLSSHTGAIGASWTAVSGHARTAVISADNRLRKETGNGGAQYYASSTPASPDYLVESDVYVASLLATDATAVVGRQDISGTGQTFYMARHVRDSNRWELAKVVGGTLTLIGTGSCCSPGFYNQTLVAGSTYRMGLQMNGSAISLLVNGVARITAPNDTSITTAGRGGIRPGTSTSTAAVSDSAGLHLDNFRITSLTTVADDTAAANNGTFTNGAGLNQPGALVGDTDRAVQLDGADDYVTVPDATSLDLGDGPLTLEAWVKRSAGGTAGYSFFQKGASAVQFGFFNNNTFLAKDNISTVTTSTLGISDTTTWHHLVVTKNGAASKLYIDGIDRTGTVTNATMINTTSALILGAKNGTSEFLNATIDEFAVYSAALPLATVLDHSNAGKGTG